MKKLKLLLFVLALAAIVGFSPVLQGVQRFKQIITESITVSKNATIQGDLTISDDLTADDLTVGDLTASGATALNGGITADTRAFSVADTTGNTVVSGTLTVSSTANMSAQPIVNIGNAGTDFGSDGGLTTAAGVTVTSGGLTLSDGDAVIADYLQITAQTAISVTDGGVITPTGSYQPLESAGAVTATLSACGTAGRVYIFVNTVAQTIIITDASNTVLSGNASLGQYDSLTAICDGTRLIQIAPESDN